MASEGDRRDLERTRPEVEHGTWRVHSWRPMAKLAAALAGVWLAHDIAATAADPHSFRARAATVLIAGVALVVAGLEIRRFVALIPSRERHVFSSRYGLTCGALLTAVTVVLVVVVVTVLDPFRQLLSTGDIAATDIADAAWIVATVIFGVGATTALVMTWDVRKEEHDWVESMFRHR